MSADGVSAPALTTIRPVLVTGGAGFIGCNLADRLAREGHDVVVYDALARAGVEQNLEWLKRRHPHRISVVIAGRGGAAGGGGADPGHRDGAGLGGTLRAVRAAGGISDELDGGDSVGDPVVLERREEVAPCMT